MEPFLDPACELTLPPELPGGGVRKGIEDTMAAFREWEGTSGVVNLEFELQELLDAEDGYFTVSLARGRGESGAPIPEHHWFHLLSLREGKLVRAQLFLDRDEAFRAAGLEE